MSSHEAQASVEELIRLGKHRVGIVVPAYNEEAHIAGVLNDVPGWVDDIIVVDDASTDGTVAAVSAQSDPRIRLVRRATNGGVGAAMVDGFAEALDGGDTVAVKVDADGQMAMSELGRLLSPVLSGRAEYSKGNRFMIVRGTVSMPRLRKLGNVALSFMTKVASGYWHVFDSQCGFVAIRTALLPIIDYRSLATDYFFENDMLLRLNRVGARVVEVPVTTTYGFEESGIRLSRIITGFPPRLLYGWWRRVTRRYFMADFGAIGAYAIAGLVLCAAGGTFGAVVWAHNAARDVATPTGTVMLAVLPVILGVQLLIQALTAETQDSPGAEETRQEVRQFLIEEGTNAE